MTIVTTNWEAWVCADLLLKRHGGLARACAVEWAIRLPAAGKVYEHRTFMLIADRIDDLARSAPSGMAH